VYALAFRHQTLLILNIYYDLVLSQEYLIIIMIVILEAQSPYKIIHTYDAHLPLRKLLL
jgi:hypothetical protein